MYSASMFYNKVLYLKCVFLEFSNSRLLTFFVPVMIQFHVIQALHFLPEKSKFLTYVSTYISIFPGEVVMLIMSSNFQLI